VKIRKAFPWMIVAILSAGFVAQAQDAPAASAPSAAVQTSASAPGTIPVTTSSTVAARDYELGLVEREDRLFVDQGLEFFRQAVKADPQFALGHAALGYFTADPTEAEQETALAVKFIDSASPDEQLLIHWMNSTKNGDTVGAISNMNDLLAKYPNDKRLGNMAAEWLCANQGAFEHGEAVLVRLLKSDPKYYPALNNLAYCYALSGQAELAPALMEKYVAALPNEPNPQDSSAEIMRILGDYPAALDHYQKALAINPHFNASQVGIASTYALMGDQKKARAQYLVAIKGTKERSTQVNYQMLYAMTYYRENKPRLAREEYEKVDAEAHAAGLTVQEAEIHRTNALFNPDPVAALKDLDEARQDLSDIRKTKVMLMPGERDIELASILQTRAFIAASAGKIDVAQTALALLNDMAQNSRSTPLQNSYHSANGAVLFAKGDYAAAIPELQEDAQNPLSLRLLAEAQSKAGQNADAQKTLTTLAAISDERVETAYAAPQARLALKKSEPQQTAQGGGTK
jgi:tetratricopeptide (TPR) repeat protein